MSRHSFHYDRIQKEWLLREREFKEREARNKLDKLKKQVRAGCALTVEPNV